jgi:hypothetical protein
MFEGEPPSFDSIVARLEKLEKQINTKWSFRVSVQFRC